MKKLILFVITLVIIHPAESFAQETETLFRAMLITVVLEHWSTAQPQ